MNCARLRQVLDAHLDGELDRATGAEIERHLASCGACAALRHERDALRERVRAEAPYFRASPALGQAVRSAVLAARGTASRPASRLAWPQAAAFASAALIVGVLLGYRLAQPVPDRSLREQIVTSHVASLNPARSLTDVASSDRHVVKPWFQGKVDFAPVVRELDAQGFVLLGGRVDHVGDRQAAAIVYRVRNHLINLFVWRAPEAGDEPLAVATARGFGVATWSEAGLRFAAVSDVDPRDLERFASLVQAPR